MTGTRPSILSGSCAEARELSQGHVHSQAPSRGSSSRQSRGSGASLIRGKVRPKGSFRKGERVSRKRQEETPPSKVLRRVAPDPTAPDIRVRFRQPPRRGALCACVLSFQRGSVAHARAGPRKFGGVASPIAALPAWGGPLRPLSAELRRGLAAPLGDRGGSSEWKAGAGRAGPRRPRSARHPPSPDRAVAGPGRPPASDLRPRGAGLLRGRARFPGDAFPAAPRAARTALAEAPSGGPGAEPWAGWRPRRGGLRAPREPPPRPGPQKPGGGPGGARARAQVGVLRVRPGGPASARRQ